MTRRNYTVGYHTEVADTAIVDLVPPEDEKTIEVSEILYETDANTHNIYIMRAVGDTETIEPASVGASSLTLKSFDPGQTTAGVDEMLAANDWIAWVDEDGAYHCDYIVSRTGSTFTLANAITVDVPVGSKVWAFYEPARSTNLRFRITDNQRVLFTGPYTAGFTPHVGGETSRSGLEDPVIFYSDNATSAGELYYLRANYV